MTITKTRIGIALIAVILVFSLLTLVFWSFVRDTIIVPIYYVVWVGGLTLNSIPQGVYLAVLVIVSVLIGVNTLLNLRVRRASRAIAEAPAQSDSRYTYWRRLCSNLSSSPFAQDSFAWGARQLILSILAYQHGVEPTQAEAMIRNNVLAVPEPIKKLIQDKKLGFINRPPQPPENMITRLRHWLFPVEDTPKSPIDDAVTEIVTYIEHLLEIDHA